MALSIYVIGIIQVTTAQYTQRIADVTNTDSLTRSRKIVLLPQRVYGLSFIALQVLSDRNTL